MPRLSPIVALLSWIRLACAGDVQWDNRFHFLFEGGQVVASAVDDRGHLYVGGAFGKIAGNPASNIALWDGTNWLSLGSGVNGQVRSIVCRSNEVFVAGIFTLAGNTAVTNIARWDGTNWSSLGDGVLGNEVNALAIDGDALYAGGRFTNAGGVSVSHIAKWRNGSWFDFNGGVRGDLSTVTALLLDRGELYVAGHFQSADGHAATNVAIWDGTEWKDLQGGVRGVAYALAKDDSGRLYVGGQTLERPYFGGPPYNGGSPTISVWDGKAWSDLPGLESGLNAPINVLFVYSNALFAGGFFKSSTATNFSSFWGLGRWNGTNWAKTDAPFYAYPSVVSQDHKSGRLFVAGPLSNIMAPKSTGSPFDAPQTGIATYDGSDWAILGAGLYINSSYPATVRSLAIVGDDLVAGGHFHEEATFQGQQLVARWNGKKWSKIGAGISTFCQPCLSFAFAADSNMLYAGGSQTPSRWDGTNWSALSSLPSTTRSIAATEDQLFAGGDFGIRRWNGQNWQPVGAGMTSVVNTIVIRGADVYVGGDFSQSKGAPGNFLARWDGDQWNAVGDGLDAPVMTLAFRGEHLIAGGAFTNAGAIIANCIAMWNGTRWTSLGTGFADGLPTDNYIRPVPTSVNALAVRSDGLIYAAGNFRRAGANAANFIAYWNGEAWLPMGSGLNLQPYALALKGLDLFVGGDFTLAGNKPSRRLALWHGKEDTALPSLRISQADQNVLLSWPAYFSDFTLETASTPFSTNAWVPVPATINGDRQIATNRLLNGHHFYRLRRD